MLALFVLVVRVSRLVRLLVLSTAGFVYLRIDVTFICVVCLRAVVRVECCRAGLTEFRSVI